MRNKLHILKKLKKLLRHRFENDIKDVILFGSQAAGTAHRDSDYDILIVLSRNYDRQFRDGVTDIVYDLELEHDILTDTHLISLGELKHSLRGAQPVFVNAVRHGVYIESNEEAPTEELTAIPGLVGAIEKSRQRIKSGEFLCYKDIRRNI